MKLTKAYQIEPAKCKGSLNFRECRELVSKNGTVPDCIAEEKFDGLRYLWQIRPNGSKHNFLTSRRVSVMTGKYVEKQDKVPWLRDEGREFPPDTIFDGEIISAGISSDTQHEMVSGEVEYRVWDILMLGGKDFRPESLETRSLVLKNLSPRFPDGVALVTGTKNILGLLNRVTREGKEGIVLKKLDAPYGLGWTKVKMEQHADVIIWDYEETKSKDWASKNWIGAIKIGQWKPCAGASTRFQSKEVPKPGMRRNISNVPHEFVDMGRASGFTQEVRASLSENQAKNLGRIVEVEYQLRFPTGKFRSPRFNRFRDDKNAWECIFAS